MKFPAWLVLAGAVLLFISKTVHANDTVQIIFNAKEFKALPGRVQNVFFTLVNPSASEKEFRIRIELPAGLKLVIPIQHIILKAGESQNLIASVNIPGQFVAGDYRVKVILDDVSTGSLITSESLNLKIAEIENLSLEWLQVPDYVMGGEKITATCLLKNLGNNKRTITLTTYNCDLTGSTAVALNPGESVTLTAIAKTNKEITSSGSHGISINAYLSETAKKSLFENVKVYALKEANSDLYFRYPVNLSARYIVRGMQGEVNNGYQIEASGSDFLDVGKKHHLEFMARGPNVGELSFLGQYDEYFLAYKHKNFESFIGDKSFSFTPLIETARYGTGTENTFITNNGSRFGFMYVEPRFFRDIKNEMAAYADVYVYKKNKIGLNYLTKKVTPTLEDARLGSITTTLKPFEYTSLELEYSRGTFRGITDDAYRVNLNSQIRFANLSGNYFHAGKNYPGYYSSTTFYNGNLNVNLTKSLSAGVSLREDFSNAALDTLWGTSPYSNMLMATLNYRVNQFLNFRTYYMDYARKDRMTVKLFDYRTRSLNSEVYHDIRKFGYQIAGEIGETRNFLASNATTDRQTTWRTTLNLRYKPTYLLYLSAFASYSNMNSFIAPNQNNWFWGLSANGQPAKNLTVNFHLQNSYAIENYYQNRNLFQLSAEYRFLKRHKISANSYYMLFQNKTQDPDFTFTLAYSVQIGIPLKKTMEAGSVTGTLIGTNGLPLKGKFVILNGRTAITDEKGFFQFKNIVPGKHQVSPDRKEMSMDEILSVPVPVTVEVLSDKNTNLTLQLVKSASVKGIIEATEAEIGLLKPEPVQPGNIVIDLIGELETIRIITNSDGSFSFPSVRPGKWSLQIYKNNVPQNYVLEKDHFEFELLPGGKTEIKTLLLPKTRKIIFQSNAIEVTSGKPINEIQKTNPVKTIEPVFDKDEVIVTVQVASSSKPIPASDRLFQKDPNIFMVRMDGSYKYFSGKFKDLQSCLDYHRKIKHNFPGSYVVAIQGGEKVPLNQIGKEEIKPWLMFFKRNKN